MKTSGIGQRGDYTTHWFLDYPYIQNYYKVIVINLSKQQKLDPDPKAINQINYTGNQYQDGNTHMFFIIEDAKETTLDFSTGTVKLLWFYFVLI